MSGQRVEEGHDRGKDFLNRSRVQERGFPRGDRGMKQKPLILGRVGIDESRFSPRRDKTIFSSTEGRTVALG